MSSRPPAGDATSQGTVGTAAHTAGDIEATLARHGVTQALVKVSDRGALDYAIDARVETALRRAAEK